VPTEEEQLATAAVTPSATDIAIASDEILKVIGEGYASTDSLFASVIERLASEPTLDVSTRLPGVDDANVRSVRSRVTAFLAIAELEACGAILPMGVQAYPHPTWKLQYMIDNVSKSYSAESGGFNVGIVAAYRAPSYRSRSRLIDSPSVFLHHLPAAMGPKVRRVLEEAINAYRFRQYVSVAVLLGIASEAAWGQLARSLLEWKPNAKLQKLIDDPRVGAADIQEKVMQRVGVLDIKGVDFHAIELTAQTYRELRNYAVHKADEAFDEIRVARPRVGVLLEASVDYFIRLYDLQARFKDE
jgi:hypothetical protein